MNPKLVEAINDAVFMFEDIEKARQLPAYAEVHRQYIALGKRLRRLLAEELEKNNE